MSLSTHDQVRSVAREVLLAVVLEEVAARLGRRFRQGRVCAQCGAETSRRRPVRRLIGAAFAEVAAAGAAEIYRKRRRMVAAVDHRIVQAEERRGNAAAPPRPPPRTGGAEAGPGPRAREGGGVG